MTAAIFLLLIKMQSEEQIDNIECDDVDDLMAEIEAEYEKERKQ